MWKRSVYSICITSVPLSISLTMAGIELMLNSIFNITAFQSSHLLPSIGSSSTNHETEKKSLREIVNGKHLIVGTLQDGPMSGFAVNEDGNTLATGISFLLMNFLRDKLNFTYDVVAPPSNIIGKDRKRISVRWLLKMLMDDKIDMIAAFIPIIPEHQELVNFSLETDTVNCLLAENKPPLRNSDLSLLQPFHASVWMYFLLAFIFYIVCLILLTRFRSKLINDKEASFTLSSSLSYTYRVCTKQDVPQSPNSSMTRILLMTWTIFTILVSTYYSGYLSRGFTAISIAREDLITSVLSLLASSGVSLNYKDLESCHDMISLHHFTRRPSGFAFPKNSSLNILFDTEIRNFYHVGMLRVFYLKYKSVKNKVCPAVKSSETRQLGLSDLSLCYYCWLIGGSVGLGVFLIELSVHCLRNPVSVLVTRIYSEKTNQNSTVDDEILTPPRQLQISAKQTQRRIVNGRHYLVARTKEGQPRLVPVDTLSTLLYDLDSYET